MRSQRRSAASRVEAAQLEAAQLRVPLHGDDQRQVDGAVEQVGAAGLPRALERPRDVEHVVEELEGEADLAAEGSELVAARAAGAEAADAAGSLEQARRLQRAAVEVAVLADARVVGVAPLCQLPERQRDRGRAELGDGDGPARGRQLGEGAGEEEVTHPDGCVAARAGDDGRAAAAHRGAVEHVVVDEGGHVDQLDRDRGAERALGLAARADQDQQGTQALAAGRERRLRVGAQLGSVAGGDLGEPPLDLREPGGQPVARGLHHHRHGRRHGGVPHAGFSPLAFFAALWIAMMPPASSSQRMDSKPAASIFAASSSGSGKLRTDSGR